MSKTKNTCCGCLFVLSITVLLSCPKPLQLEAGSKAAKTVLIENVPHIRQKPDFCGEACVAMFLRKLGHEVSQDDVFNLSGVDPLLGRGCITRDMEQVLKRIGFRPGSVWYKIDPKKHERQLESQWDLLLADLSKDIPSIVCMHYDSSPHSSEHFRLILGYDPNADEVIYHEPAERNGAYRRMDRTQLLALWPLKYSKSEWLAIRMRLDPGSISLPTTENRSFTSADYAQHIMRLKPSVPLGFTVVLEKPFVVIGDEAPATVKYRAKQTVRWFVDRAKGLYFDKDPSAIYDIWLFKDDKSYRKHARELFNDNPDTPFGYCSDSHRALVMNIATGGGTLCHEIVHAFVASNFPRCPSWFNEGLASLYEQCGSKNNRLVGFTNWRLAGLQREIRAGTLPSFRELLSTTTHQFYNMTRGNNYAQARYLCYYLQEKNLLVKFYDNYRRDIKKDPSGYGTLKQVLHEDDMEEFQDHWQQWVLKLRFP
jgi:hypothetical protein